MDSQSACSTLDGGGDLPETPLDLIHQRQNPLMNDVILSRLFEHLNTKDLQTSRLVCKKWHFGSILSARSEFQVNLGESESSLENFVQVLRSNKLGNPFAKFHLSAFDTTKGVGREFLQLCGGTSKGFVLFRMNEGSTFMVQDVTNLLKAAPRLESFHLPLSLNSKNGEAVRLFPDERPNLPFLKEIAIGPPNDSVLRRKFCPTLFDVLFTAAKNVSTLILSDYLIYGIKNDSLEVLETLEKLGRESSIRNLSLRYARMEHLELLKKMVVKQNGLKLKTLEYETPHGTGQQFRSEIIELFKDTLISLTLGYNWMDSGRFPKMLKLRELKLYHPIMMNFENFHNNLPALEILNIRCANGILYHQFNRFLSGLEEPCSKMTELILQGGQMRTEAFCRVVTTFPNLKELQMEVIYVPILRRIFSRFTQLEVLRISGLLNTTGRLDSLFTRIFARDIDQFGDPNECSESLAKMTLEARRQAILKLRNEHRKSSSIANLTNLRTLTLDIQGKVKGRKGKCNALSDLTGILGLYSLEKLKNLVIRRCLFSKTCSEMLVADMKLQAWSFTGVDGTEIIPSSK